MRLSREPAAWGAAIVAIVSALVAFRLPWLTGDHEVLITVAVDAVVGLWVAARVRPFAPSAVTYLITALANLVAGYGLDVPAHYVAGLNGLVVALIFALTRVQQTPKADPAPLDQVVG